VRENGGQYTHAALWVVRALAEIGDRERAAPALAQLSPVRHGGTPERAQRYLGEPYVIAADIYGVEPHIGRVGWTWYTGSAGWMLRVALESVLGVRFEDGNVLVRRTARGPMAGRASMCPPPCPVRRRGVEIAVAKSWRPRRARRCARGSTARRSRSPMARCGADPA
jgi:hypothetical protein